MRRSARVSSAKATQKLLHKDSEGDEVDLASGPGPSSTTAAEEAKPSLATQAQVKAKGRKRKAVGANPAPAAGPAEPSIETSESLDTPAVEAGLPAKGTGKQVVARTPSPAPPTDVHMQEAEPLSADAMSELAPVPPFRSAESLDDSDDYRSEDELPAKKKKTAKKALEKKVASWRELAMPSNVSFSQFPVEIMDAIVNVDSDLDLRDHLALSATCRSFRSAYTDVVWQVLFQGAFPEYAHLPVDDISVSFTASTQRTYYGGATIKSDPTLLSSYVRGPMRGEAYHWNAKAGPFERGFKAARWIFSSPSTGAPGVARWGQSKVEWLAGEPERTALQDETREAVLARPDLPVKYSYDGRMEYMPSVFETPIYRELSEHERRCWPSWQKQEADRILKEALASEQEAIYDAWPSPWRALVFKIVGRPLLTKTDAKKYFKLGDRELLSVPLVLPVRDGPERFASYGIPPKGGYRLSTLTALALRAHGGVDGHKAHLAKLAERAKKAKATRVANGTDRVAKPRGFHGPGPLSNLSVAVLEQMIMEFGDDFYDDYDEYYDEFGYSDGYDSDYGYGGGGLW